MPKAISLTRVVFRSNRYKRASRHSAAPKLQLDGTSLAYLNDLTQRACVTNIGGDGDKQHLITFARSTKRSPISPLA
jgi:hypothetical protein